MSASGRSAAALTGHVRHSDDFYATPAWCTGALLDVVPLAPRLSVLEPAAGEGAVVREILRREPKVKMLATEIDPERAKRLGTVCDTLCVNFLEWKPPSRFDLVVTNPPFAIAMDFVEASLHVLKRDGVCAMLLRLNWLASIKRASFLRRFCPDVYVLPRRPSFTGGGTDATDYGWFVWRGTEPRPRGVVEVLDVGPLIARRLG